MSESSWSISARVDLDSTAEVQVRTATDSFSEWSTTGVSYVSEWHTISIPENDFLIVEVNNVSLNLTDEWSSDTTSAYGGMIFNLKTTNAYRHRVYVIKVIADGGKVTLKFRS